LSKAPQPTQDDRGREEKRSDIHALSGIRTHDPNDWASECIYCLLDRAGTAISKQRHQTLNLSASNESNRAEPATGNSKPYVLVSLLAIQGRPVRGNWSSQCSNMSLDAPRRALLSALLVNQEVRLQHTAVRYVTIRDRCDVPQFWNREEVRIIQSFCLVAQYVTLSFKFDWHQAIYRMLWKHCASINLLYKI
jgi:hypothetical protein